MLAAIHQIAPNPLPLRTASVNKKWFNNQSFNMLKKIALPTMEGISFENLHEIISLEAQGNYTLIYFADGRQILVCRTLSLMEDMLEGGAFVRIHRSATINLDKIKHYVKGKTGYVIMENEMHINISEGKKQDFLAVLKEYFGL